MSNLDYEPLINLSVKKSNEMISAKYQSTLLENQVMSIALTRIEVNYKNIDAPLESKLYPGELKKLIGDPTHIYRALKTISKTITGHTMVLEDGKGNFHAFAVVTNAEYQDGVFVIRFNEKLKPHILGLEKNYTTLELSVLTNFKRNASFRLYELLKREMYKSRADINEGRVDIEYNIFELKFMIGLANSDDQKLRNEMGRMGNNIDWEVLYELLDKNDKKYEDWRDFQKNVIKIAQEELIEKSNIRFDYIPIREGRRIKRIRFQVYKNKPILHDEIMQRKEILDNGKYKQEELLQVTYKKLFDDYQGHNKLTTEDIELLLKKSIYDESKVRRAIELADKKDNIVNYMGWIISCIENDYDEVEVIYGDNELAERVSDIRKDLDVNKDKYAAKAWFKIKQKDDFKRFEAELERNKFSVSMLETVYEDYADRVKIYCEWATGKGMNI